MPDNSAELSLDELDGQFASPLPHRDLLIAVSLLGIPLAGVDPLTININTSGPNWLATV